MGRDRTAGPNVSPLTPLGIGMREIAERFSGLRSMPMCSGMLDELELGLGLAGFAEVVGLEADFESLDVAGNEIVRW